MSIKRSPSPTSPDQKASQTPHGRRAEIGRLKLRPFSQSTRLNGTAWTLSLDRTKMGGDAVGGCGRGGALVVSQPNSYM